MSLPISTLTGSNTIAQLIYNVNRIKTLAANTSNPIFNGNVGIGGTPAEKLDVIAPDNSSIVMARVTRSSKDYGIALENNGSTGDSTINAFGSGAALIFETASTERARITSGGTLAVGDIGGLNSELIHARRSSGTISTLYNSGSTGDVLRLYHENTAVTAFSIWGVGAQRGFITSPVSNNGLIFGTSSTERMRLDTYGRLVHGYTSATTFGTDGWGSGIQEYDIQGIAIIRSAADAFGGALNLVSSRGSVGSPTIVTSGDRLGGIYFSGYDGGDFNSYGAAIEAQVDGTPGVNDMPGRLLFYTVADGSNTLSERMRLDSTGAATFAGDVGVRGAPGTTFGTDTWGPELQAVGGQGIASLRASGDAFGGALNLAGARGTFGSPSIVLNNDALGAVYFDGFDGGDYLSYGASIVAYVDGTPGVNDMPTRLVFSTSADGSNTPTERMRIDSHGNLGIATAIDHNGRLSIKSTGTEQHLVLEQENVTTDGWGIRAVAAGGYFEISRMTGTTTFTPRVTINSSGNLGIGTSNPDGKLHVQVADASATPSTLGDDFVLESTGNMGMTLLSDDTGSSYIFFGSTTDADAAFIRGSYSSGSQYLAFGTDGTERFRVNSSGNFGIGTTTIESFGGGHKTLEVSGSSNAHGGVFKTATSDSAGAGSAGTEMLMYTNSSGGAISVTSADPLLFQTSSTERARITSGGTFVVGTTAGLTSELIHARRSSGTISTLYNNGSTGDVLRLYHENTAVTAFSIWGVGAQRGFITSPVSSNGLIFGTSSTEQARFDDNGLRIGTTAEVITATGGELVSLQGTATKSPLAINSSGAPNIRSWNTGSSAATRYHFIGSNAAGLQEFHLRRETNGDIRLASLLGSLQLDGNSNGILFLIAGSERMRLDSSGNLGIGTSTSDALLYARRTSGTTAPIGRFEAAIGAFTGTSLTAQNTLGTSNTYNLFTCVTDSDGDAGGPYTLFSIRGDGKVGIGNSPLNQSALRVHGSISVTTSDTDFGAGGNRAMIDLAGPVARMGAINGGGGPLELALYSATAECMRINSSGNIGIGTTSPDKQLTLYSATDASQGISLRNQSAGTSAASYISMGNDSDALDGQIFLTGSMNTSYAGTRSFNFLSNVGAFGFYRSRLSPVATMVMDTSGNVGIGTSSPVTTLDVTGTARATQGTPYTTYTANTKTLALTDNGYYTRCSNTTLITITIPNNSTVAFPLGSEMIFFQAGSGNVLFANAAGVTLNSKESNSEFDWTIFSCYT
jgi:hypothetical protein